MQKQLVAKMHSYVAQSAFGLYTDLVPFVSYASVRAMEMSFPRCTSSVGEQLAFLLAVMVVRGAARAGWDYGHVPTTYLNEVCPLTFDGCNGCTLSAWTIQHIVTTVRLNFWCLDPTSKAIDEILDKYPSHAFGNLYFLMCTQTKEAADALEKSGAVKVSPFSAKLRRVLEHYKGRFCNLFTTKFRPHSYRHYHLRALPLVFVMFYYF